jgi:hypothetical protein
MKQCDTCSDLQKDVVGKHPTMNYQQAHEAVQKGRDLTKAFQNAERALKRHVEDHYEMIA